MSGCVRFTRFACIDRPEIKPEDYCPRCALLYREDEAQMNVDEALDVLAMYLPHVDDDSCDNPECRECEPVRIAHVALSTVRATLLELEKIAIQRQRWSEESLLRAETAEAEVTRLSSLLKRHVPKGWLEDEQRDHRHTKSLLGSTRGDCFDSDGASHVAADTTEAG